MELELKIPILNECAMAFHMDIKQKKEYLLMGEKEEIKKYLSGVRDHSLLLQSERPIGSFLRECLYSDAPAMIQIQNDLFTSIKSNHFMPTWEESLERLQDYYQGDNLALRFMSLAIWQRYRALLPLPSKRIRKPKAPDKASADMFDKFIGELTFPFRYEWSKDASFAHAVFKSSATRRFPREFYIQNAEILFQFQPDAAEYILVEDSLLPVIMYCLRTSSQVGLHFVQCSICGKVFMTKSGRASYCSKKCKKAIQAETKKRYDEKVQEVLYEKNERTTHMYWYNRVKKWQENPAYADRMSEIIKAYDSFKKEKSKKKKLVKDNALTASVFESWLLLSRDVIDDFEIIP